MRVIVMTGVIAFLALSAAHDSVQAACITEPIDRSERAEALRSRTIADFVRRDIIYKIVKMSETAIEVQVTARFLELPFDMKQVLAWSVFSANFDGADEKQTIMFTDNRTLKDVGRFDACRGLSLS